MRFHIGFSKRISWKWIIGAIGVIAAFFFGNHVVLAATSGSVNMTPTRVRVFDNSDSSWQNQTMTFRTASSGSVLGDNYYTSYSPTTNGGVQHGPIFSGTVEWYMPAKDLCPSAGVINYEFRYFVRPQVSYGELFPSNGFGIIGLNDSISWKLISRNLSTTGNIYIVKMQVPNNLAFKLRFYFDADTSNAYYVSSSVNYTWVYNCDYSLEESTTDIINNLNQNAQDIIDNLNDPSITTDTTNFANTMFGQDPFANHGLQSIITAPITLLQGILNASTGTCTNLMFDVPFLGSTGHANIPCGDIIWSHVPNTALALYQTTIFGFMIYFVLSDIVKTINECLDPERKNDFVMQL